MIRSYGWLSAVLLFTVSTGLQAQLRTVAFEQWAPPRIAAERTATAYADSVQVRVGSHAGKGALIGAALGAGIGVITGFALGAGGCADCADDGSPVGTAAIGGLVGAGVGGLIGVLFGLSSPKYEWRQE